MDEVKEALDELSRLLPGEVNQEIADRAEVSAEWVSQVRNGRKESRRVLLEIANVAKEKGERAALLAEKLLLLLRTADAA